MGKLSAKQVDAELRKPREKKRKIFDGEGLFLEIPVSGKGRWRFKFRVERREKLLSLGVYPDTSLKQAREKHQDLRRLLAQGIDPAAARKEEQARAENTFEEVAREWHAKEAHAWDPGHAKTVMSRLELKVFPYLGKKPIDEVSARELHEVIQRIEAEKKYSTAHTVLSICARVFRYAIRTSRSEKDPSLALRGALVKETVKHRSGLTEPKQFAALLRSIDDYEGHASTLWALQLAPLVFVRPGELRHVEWTEVDFTTSTWTLLAEKMKMKKDHIVPLSRQAVAIFEKARPLHGGSRYVFPSMRSNARPMSDNTLNAALRRLGFSKDEMTAHGFRASARTMLDEVLRKRPDLIEHQLAHAVKGPLGRAYNRAEFLDERREMMQDWADYLDKIKAEL